MSVAADLEPIETLRFDEISMLGIKGFRVDRGIRHVERHHDEVVVRPASATYNTS